MFESLVALLGVLNTLSPLAVIALLALVLFYQAKNKESIHSLRTNDLHELPDLAQSFRDIAAALQRIETNQATNFATIIAKLNGRH